MPAQRVPSSALLSVTFQRHGIEFRRVHGCTTARFPFSKGWRTSAHQCDNATRLSLSPLSVPYLQPFGKTWSMRSDILQSVLTARKERRSLTKLLDLQLRCSTGYEVYLYTSSPYFSRGIYAYYLSTLAILSALPQNRRSMVST